MTKQEFDQLVELTNKFNKLRHGRLNVHLVVHEYTTNESGEDDFDGILEINEVIFDKLTTI